MNNKKRIDWDLIQIILIVGTIPAMLLVGAFFPTFFRSYS
jgi:hypothetical protein